MTTHQTFNLGIFDRLGNRIRWALKAQPKETAAHVVIMGIEGDDVAYISIEAYLSSKIQHLTPEAFAATYAPSRQ